MRTLLLIDSHALIHRFFHALPPLTTPEHDQIGAIYGLSVVLMKMLNPAPEDGPRPDYIVAALDRPEPTFRAKAFTDYKIHRPPAPDTLIFQLKMMPEVFEQFGIKTASVAGFEADDIIGTLAEKFKAEPNLLSVILSGDLDVLQLIQDDKIVVNLIKSGTSNLERYNEAKVLARYGVSVAQLPDYKGLVGDTSDNIPGVKGVGPKGARELLQEFKTLDQIYEDIGLVKRSLAEKLEANRESAFASRDLATIRRDAPVSIQSLEELKSAPLSREKLTPFFTRLGFQSLISRLPT